MEIATLVLEYFKVLLSPQVAAAAVAVTFFFLFRSAITNLIGRISKLKVAGAEVSASQLERSSNALADTEAQPTPEELDIDKGLHLTEEQVKVVSKAVENIRTTARLWEYRYLRYFLVPSTELVLDDLINGGGQTTIDLLDARLHPLEPAADERNAIISALESHHLIQLTGQIIQVTEKGRDYARWRGPASRLQRKR